MTAALMVFAALVAAPAASFLCRADLLFFFILFPVAALLERRRGFFRSLFFVSLAPFLLLIWAAATGHGESALRSLRWICAISSGVYFAGALGPSGIAAVLREADFLPPAERLSETMLLAGAAVSRARDVWTEGRGLSLGDRLSFTVRNSLSAEAPADLHLKPPGSTAVSIAVASWIFLLASLSGRAV